MSSLWGEVWDPERQCTTDGDVLYDTILRAAGQRNIDYCYTDFLSHVGLKLAVLRRKKRRYKKEYVPLECYMTGKSYLKALRRARGYVRKWRQWREDPEFRQIFSYRRVNLWPWYEGWFDRIVNQFLPFACFYAELMREFQNGVTPRLLLHTPEAGFYGRIFSAVSQSNGVKSVGLNHAFAYRQNPNIMHRKGDIERAGAYINSCKCPLADMTLILGGLEEPSYLEDGNYPADRLMRIGAPRFDSLITARSDTERDKFRASFDIDRSEFVVMFAAQPPHRVYHDPSLYWEDIRVLCKAVGSIDGLLIIRPHPQESRKHLGRYEKTANSVGLYKIMLIEDMNLFQMLWGSDCSCTVSSNVIYESIVAFRPGLYLRTNDGMEPFGLLLDKVLEDLPVIQNEEQLRDLLLRIKSDREFKEEFLVFREQRLGRLVTNIDGTATSKVMSYVESELGSGSV